MMSHPTGFKQIFFSANSASKADGNERRIYLTRRNLERENQSGIWKKRRRKKSLR
jgi:hypothetical protein